jgi:hypothetical protein
VDVGFIIVGRRPFVQRNQWRRFGFGILVGNFHCGLLDLGHWWLVLLIVLGRRAK